MVLMVAFLVGAAGTGIVLIVAGLGWFLMRWLGTAAPLTAALLLTAASVADVILVRNILAQPGDNNTKGAMQIMAWGYGAPLLAAIPCALLLARLFWKR